MREGVRNLFRALLLVLGCATLSLAVFAQSTTDGAIGGTVVDPSKAVVVGAKVTVRNVETIKKYLFLKNGAMYSVLFLGTIMLLHSFGWHIPEWLSPAVTILIIGGFWWKSVRAARGAAAPAA